jgi:hypothetical protein
MSVRSCKVTIEDMNGVRHTVDVTAGSLYEAVALGMAAIRRVAQLHDSTEPSPTHTLDATPSCPPGVMLLHLGAPSLMLFKRGFFATIAMPKGLHRRCGLRHLHFITCSCYRRLLLFASARPTGVANLF